MTMRRFALITGLVAGTLAFGSTAAFADTVNLAGSIASTNTLNTTTLPAASTLNLYGVGTDQAAQVVQVASVALTTNNDEGIQLSADGGTGKLTNPESGELAFTVLLVDTTVTPVAGDFSSASQTVNVEPSDFTNNAATQHLYISYDPPAYLDPGAYSASITVTLGADL